MAKSEHYRTDEQVIREQIKDVEKGIRIHQRAKNPAMLVRHLEARLKQLNDELERLRWRE